MSDNLDFYHLYTQEKSLHCVAKANCEDTQSHVKRLEKLQNSILTESLGWQLVSKESLLLAHLSIISCTSCHLLQHSPMVLMLDSWPVFRKNRLVTISTHSCSLENCHNKPWHFLGDFL